jgi:hypothetical protein
VVGVVAFASLITLSRHPRGAQAIVACLAAAGVAVIVARLIDVVAPFPRLAPQVPRGGAGVVVGAMVRHGRGGRGRVRTRRCPPARRRSRASSRRWSRSWSTCRSTTPRRAGRWPAKAPAMWLARHMQGPLAAFALAAPAAYASATLLLNTL